MSRHRLLQPLVVMTFLMVPVIPGPVTPCRNVPGLGPSSWVVAVMGMNGQKIHVRGKAIGLGMNAAASERGSSPNRDVLEGLTAAR